MDVTLYAFSLTAIQEEFHLSAGRAGVAASMTLLASALGGILSGFLADRYGRARLLLCSILTYSLFTGAAATSRAYWQFVLWRGLVGFGLGAEWSAGSVLVAETWPAEHRGAAIGIMQSGWAVGYVLAAVLAAAVLPGFGWRPLFALGALPAFLALWVWRNVPEPEVWRRTRSGLAEAGRTVPLGLLFKRPLLGRAALASSMAAILLFAYWGLFTWVPTYLASPVSKGGAGLGLVKSTAWIVPVQIGAFLGYTMFGALADRYGRRPVLLAFVLGAAASVPLYSFAGASPNALLALGPVIGFFGHGYFSVFGAMLAELFPSSIRATAQGLCYNLGRGVSALAPLAIGWISEAKGLAGALACTSAFFLLAATLIWFLPETRGEPLA